MPEADDGSDSPFRSPTDAGDRVIYVMPERKYSSKDETELDIRKLIRSIWEERRSITSITAVFAVAATVYVLWAPSWYRSNILLAPVQQSTDSVLGAQFGGLASIAGVKLTGDNSIAESVAIVQSRELAHEFLEENDLLTTLLHEQWDAKADRWSSSDPEDWPDIRDAIEFLHRHVLTVDQERQSGLVTLSVNWIDPEKAALWANDLASRANQRIRARALRDAEANVAFLQQELASTNVVELQQSIGRLLENEMQKLMLARGNEEYAFRVIDAAKPAGEPSSPNRPMTVTLGTFTGFLVALLWALLARSLRRSV